MPKKDTDTDDHQQQHITGYWRQETMNRVFSPGGMFENVVPCFVGSGYADVKGQTDKLGLDLEKEMCVFIRYVTRDARKYLLKCNFGNQSKWISNLYKCGYVSSKTTVSRKGV